MIFLLVLLNKLMLCINNGCQLCLVKGDNRGDTFVKALATCTILSNVVSPVLSAMQSVFGMVVPSMVTRSTWIRTDAKPLVLSTSRALS